MMMKNQGSILTSLHIFALSAFAIAQPLLDIISQNPEILVAQKILLADLLLLIVLVCFALPAMLCLPGQILHKISPRLSQWSSAAVIGGLASLFLLIVLKNRVGLPDWVLISLVLLLGSGFVFAYRRAAAVRLFCSFLTPVIIVVPALFLFSDDVSRVILGITGEDSSNDVQAADTPVVVLVLDELPIISLLNDDAEIDELRFPNFSSLAKGSHWFRNATTNSGVTSVAVPAILSGLYTPNALPILADYPQNLFTLLTPGHSLEVFETITSLCPRRLCEHSETVQNSADSRLKGFFSDLSVVYLHLIAPAGLSQRLPVITQGWSNFADNRSDSHSNEIDWFAFVNSRVEDYRLFVSNIDNEPEPSLYYYHLLLPHMPWEYLPSGKLYSITGSRVPGLDAATDRWGENQQLVTQGYQRHLLQLVFIDQLVGELIKRLQTQGIYDDALIVVVSDHGANFWPGSLRRGSLSSEQNLDVEGIALFIKLPNQHRGITHDESASSIDILPTLAAQLNLPLTMRVHGGNLFEEGTSVASTQSAEFNDYRSNKTLAHKIAHFGSGNPDKIYHTNDLPTQFSGSGYLQSVATNSPFGFEVDQQTYLDETKLNSPLIPNWITGSIISEVDILQPLDLLITLNGVAVTTTSTYQQGNLTNFSVLVPEQSIQDGRNTIELYWIHQEQNGLALQPLINIGENSYSYLDDSKNLIVDQLGNQLNILHGATIGRADRIISNPEHLRLQGWAIGSGETKSAEYLLTDINGELSYAGNLGLNRPDVKSAFSNLEDDDSGFSFLIPRRYINSTEPNLIQIIAASDGDASVIDSFVYLVGTQSESGFVLSTNLDVISDPQNRQIFVQQNLTTGNIDTASIDGNILSLEGWAANDSSTQPVDYFLLEINDQLLFLGAINKSRPDVAAALSNDALEASGFSFKLDIEGLIEGLNEGLNEGLDTAPIDNIRLLAVCGNQATEVASKLTLPSDLFQ